MARWASAAPPWKPSAPASLHATAAGSAAHSDHGRDLAFTLKAVAKGEAKGFKIRDPFKLRMVAEHLDIKTEGRLSLDIANDVADKAIAEFGPKG